jgi:hypothetical protein
MRQLLISLIRFCAITLVSPTLFLLLGQSSATLETHVTEIKAGENFYYTIKLDQAPSFEGGGIVYRLFSKGANAWSYSSGIPIGKGQKETPSGAHVPIPADAPSGQYEFGNLEFVTGGGKRIRLDVPSITFNVVGNTDLQYPSKAQITIQPTQTQLLRTEARALGQRVQELKSRITKLRQANQGSTAELLRSVDLEQVLVERTRRQFLALGGNPDLTRIADVFFEDIGYRYRTLSTNLKMISQQRPDDRMVVKPVSFSSTENQSSNFTAPTVYHALESNELAYNLAADSGLVFELKVNSNPPDATISLARAGERPKEFHDHTNASIPSLPLAIWTIYLHKAGFIDQDREFNPFTDRDKFLDVTLQPVKH